MDDNPVFDEAAAPIKQEEPSPTGNYDVHPPQQNTSGEQENAQGEPVQVSNLVEPTRRKSTTSSMSSSSRSSYSSYFSNQPKFLMKRSRRYLTCCVVGITILLSLLFMAGTAAIAVYTLIEVFTLRMENDNLQKSLIEFQRLVLARFNETASSQ